MAMIVLTRELVGALLGDVAGRPGVSGWLGQLARARGCPRRDAAPPNEVLLRGLRAGHSVEGLLRVYAKCIEGRNEAAKRRIEQALRDD
jgi:hypothetical protein